MNRVTGFNRDTTAEEVLADIDLSGKLFLVTGASSGLGQETTRLLASRGASVIMAVRSLDKGLAAAATIKDGCPDADLDVRLVDLASLASIRAFTDGRGSFLRRPRRDRRQCRRDGGRLRPHG